MNYEEKLSWLFRQLPMFSRIGAAAYKPGLERSLALAEHFGNPQNAWRSIHVAGTNGKGSVSHLLAATLQNNGYKVGLYTSPHLVDFRERMRINGEMIPKEKVEKFIDEWRAVSNSYPDRPSFFELTMMMAFKWFADEKIDIAVIEVGMGGRLDSTNIITPLMSVITNISWDHSQFLGDTLGKIAGEKAGIMKAGVPVVIGEAEGEVRDVFRNHAEKAGAPLIEAYGLIDSEANARLEAICTLKGDYQHYNLNTFRVAVQTLQSIIGPLDSYKTEQAVGNVTELTGLRGRWEVLSQTPLTICDTGHNEAGIRSNMAQLKRLMDKSEKACLHMVVGFVADKDLDHILPLFPSGAKYYLTQAQIPRALNVLEFKKKGDALGWNSDVYPTVKEAFTAAKVQATSDDIIFIGGSTFIVADLLAALDKQ